MDPLYWQPPFKMIFFISNENSKPIPIPSNDYIKIPDHKRCFCKTNMHILKSLIHVKFQTFSYDKKIHLCSYSISLTHRNLNNRVHNLCHEVHSRNRSTAKSEVLVHHTITKIGFSYTYSELYRYFFLQYRPPYSNYKQPPQKY